MIKQNVKLRLSPHSVYKIQTDSKHHTALTGQKAVFSSKVGGPFSTRDGHENGITVDLAPDTRIVRAWRSDDFPIGAYSMASIELNRACDGGTELVLTYRGVPKTLIPAVETDWRNTYWDKLRQMRQEKSLA